MLMKYYFEFWIGYRLCHWSSLRGWPIPFCG